MIIQKNKNLEKKIQKKKKNRNPVKPDRTRKV